MRAISGRNANCRATSLPIPALAPVINTDFTGVVLIVIASLLVEVQLGLAERHGRAAGRCGGPVPARRGPVQHSAVVLPRRPQARNRRRTGMCDPSFSPAYGIARPFSAVCFCRCLREVLIGGG